MRARSNFLLSHQPTFVKLSLGANLQSCDSWLLLDNNGSHGYGRCGRPKIQGFQAPKLWKIQPPRCWDMLRILQVQHSRSIKFKQKSHLKTAMNSSKEKPSRSNWLDCRIVENEQLAPVIYIYIYGTNINKAPPNPKNSGKPIHPSWKPNLWQPGKSPTKNQRWNHLVDHVVSETQDLRASEKATNNNYRTGRFFVQRLGFCKRPVRFYYGLVFFAKHFDYFKWNSTISTSNVCKSCYTNTFLQHTLDPCVSSSLLNLFKNWLCVASVLLLPLWYSIESWWLKNGILI